MFVLSWLLVLLIGGALGRVMLPSESSVGSTLAVLLGVFGALVSAAVAVTFGVTSDALLVLPATAGAAVLLLAYRAFSRLAMV